MPWLWCLGNATGLSDCYQIQPGIHARFLRKEMHALGRTAAFWLPIVYFRESILSEAIGIPGILVAN
jgi:hypothetical protein